MHRRCLRIASGAAVSVMLGAGLSGHVRGQTAPAQQQRPPVFRGESVLVTVDVYPQRDGKIVEGLKAEDFQVLEDGKPQTVENLEFVRVEPTLSESTRRDPNSISEMNALAADPHNRVFVVFLDRLHATVDSSHNARRPLVDTLNRIIGENDLFGVMTQNTDPRALTLGRRLLSVEEQLSKYWDWGERNRIGIDRTDPMEETLKQCYEYLPLKPGQAPLQPWLVSDNGQTRSLYEVLVDRRREDRTLTALERLVERLGGMREARTVTLLVTEGWRLFPRNQGLANEAGKYFTKDGPLYNPIPPIGSSGGKLTLGDQSPNKGTYADIKACQDELVRLANLENEVRFRDLMRTANRANVSFYPINAAGLVVFDTPISEKSPPSLVEDGNRLRNRTDAMLTLADNTDGIAVVRTNDIAAGMRRIVDDVSAYYLLGYYSTNTVHDGKFRKIEVRTRASGLTVRNRRGYYAPNNKPSRETYTPAPKGSEPPKELDAALGELSRLRVSADLFMRGTIVNNQALITVELASSRSALSPWNGGANVQVVATPDGGAPLAAVTARIEPNSRAVTLSVPVPPSASSLRVIAKASAGEGSAEETSEVRRAPSAPIGEAVLFRGRPAATSPLKPVADLQYRRTERVHVEWAVAGELEQRSARLLSKTGQPLPVPVTLTERDTEAGRVVAADLNLAPLSAGDYVIELTAGRAGATVVRLVAFRVLQ